MPGSDEGERGDPCGGKFPLAAGRRDVVDCPRSAGRRPGGQRTAGQSQVARAGRNDHVHAGRDAREAGRDLRDREAAQGREALGLRLVRPQGGECR